MSRPLRIAALMVAAAGTLALGGCRGGVAAAPTPSAVDSQAAAAGEGSAGASTGPLGSIESSIAAVEKQVDQDGTG